MNGKKYYHKFKNMNNQNKDINRQADAEDIKQPDVKEEETIQGEDPEAEAEEVVAEAEETAEAEVAEESAEQKLAREAEELKAQVEKGKNEYMFLMAEFDNFRKRTLREKSELVKNAGEGVFKGLLPIVDDFERALKASEGSDDAQGIREGMELIYKKLRKFMEQNGVKEMDPEDKEFDADRHEAITAVPVADEAQKGKIIDTVEKGYTINGKVLRHAKVVVGK